ncbi:MAG: hypothetical protein K8L91_04305 [Anaerolineae bacterium]|nr:hypothetical protein [Anaerolineae bacterium]
MSATVYLENTEFPFVVRMVWAQQVNEADVLPTFTMLTRQLNASPRPITVIMDLSNKPQMPLAETLTGAMSGPFGHPNLGYWVMIGTTRVARIVENVLTKVLRQQNMIWFDSHEEADAFIREKAQEDGREVA